MVRNGYFYHIRLMEADSGMTQFNEVRRLQNLMQANIRRLCISGIAMNTAKLISMLPGSNQYLVYELVKKLVLAWDPDYTMLTQDEADRIEAAKKADIQ